MIRVTNSLPPRKNRSPKAEPENAPASEIRRLVHEIVNHLTVMNLCCFRFREAALVRLPATSLADIDTMEMAVGQIASLLDDLAKIKNTKPRRAASVNAQATQPTAKSSGPSSNVYPLFTPLHQRQRD